MNNSNSEALFNDILAATDLNYMSDLHYRDYYDKILQAVKTIGVEGYSAEDWSSVASYVSGSHKTFDSPQQAAEFLIGFLSPKDE